MLVDFEVSSYADQFEGPDSPAQVEYVKNVLTPANCQLFCDNTIYSIW
jgi:hypothetical protein